MNTEFVRVISPDHVKMRVWERGSGITMACGTGACATAAAAVERGLVQGPCTIVMDGGSLTIDCDKASGKVVMTGPATTVFEGIVEV